MQFNICISMYMLLVLLFWVDDVLLLCAGVLHFIINIYCHSSYPNNIHIIFTIYAIYTLDPIFSISWWKFRFVFRWRHKHKQCPIYCQDIIKLSDLLPMHTSTYIHIQGMSIFV